MDSRHQVVLRTATRQRTLVGENREPLRCPRYHIYRSILTLVGTLSLFCFLAEPAGAAVRITGETSRPEMSTFSLGEAVQLLFSVEGLALPQRDDLSLTVRIEDERGKLLSTKTMPVMTDTAGTWHASVDAPHDHLGFYRVYAELSDGTKLDALGSRPKGYLTYCVVPDPADRKLYPDTQTFFGLQGGFNRAVNVLPYLGVRWVLGGFAWKDLEQDHAGQLGEHIARVKEEKKQLTDIPGIPDWSWPYVDINGRHASWMVYTLPTLFFLRANNMKWLPVAPETLVTLTGRLTPQGELQWVHYVSEAVSTYAALYPERTQRYYQLTWEPVSPWGFTGTAEDIVRIYELAYPAIHKADPKAVVIGPTGGSLQEDIEWNLDLFRKGLGRYIDGFSNHPYVKLPPEQNGLIDASRRIGEFIRENTGKTLLMFGTEQGFSAPAVPDAELEQARALVRSNLILLGESWRMNIAFYLHDFRGDNARYGLYYNLVEGLPFGPNKIGPKPAAPAYAAVTYLLEGHQSLGPIKGLDGTEIGYSYQLDDEIVLALWDYGDKPRRATIPVDAQELEIYDMMGNVRKASVPEKNIELLLDKDPVYIRYIRR